MADANSSSVSTFVTINPISLKDKSNNTSGITVSLIDNSAFAPSGSGGWQIVDRPKSSAATQWFDRAPWTLEFECYLDHSITSPSTPAEGIGDSVEGECSLIESWMNPVATTYQPPVFTLTGPLPGVNSRNWVIYSVAFTDAIRDPITGERVQQRLKFSFYEYLPPLASGYTEYGLTQPAIFKASNQSSNSGGTGAKATQYTIKQKDTIKTISTKFARKFGGDANKAAAKIKAKNTKIKSGDWANVGQTHAGEKITIPGS